MAFRSDMRRLLLPLIVVFAIVAVIVPTCQMVGCTAPMRFLPLVTTGLSITGPGGCGGAFVFSNAPLAVPPTGADSLLLSLATGLAVAGAALFAPRADLTPVRVVRVELPPPPEDPRGERLLI